MGVEIVRVPLAFEHPTDADGDVIPGAHRASVLPRPVAEDRLSDLRERHRGNAAKSGVRGSVFLARVAHR